MNRRPTAPAVRPSPHRVRSVIPYLVVLCAISMFTVVGTASPAGSSRILVGASLGLTGFCAPYDVAVQRGMNLAANQINNAGGIGGKYKITFDYRDDASDGGQTVLTTTKLLSDKPNVLVLPCNEALIAAAGNVVKKYQLAAFTINSAAYTPLYAPKHIFQVYGADNYAGTAAARYARAQKFKTAYLVTSPDLAYFNVFPSYFAASFKKAGGKIVGTGTFSQNQTDFSALITTIKAISPPPNVIMTAMFEPAFPAFLTQLRQSGVTIPVIGSNALDSPTIYALPPDVTKGLAYPVDYYPAPGSKLLTIMAKIKAKYGASAATPYVGAGYDMIQLLKAAVLKAKSTDPGAIRNAMATLKPVPTSTGTIGYAGTNGAPTKPVFVVSIVNHRPVARLKITLQPSEVPPPKGLTKP